MNHLPPAYQPTLKNSLTFSQILSCKKCPVKHSADVGHSLHISHFSPALCERITPISYSPPEASMQTPQPSSNFALFQR